MSQLEEIVISSLDEVLSEGIFDVFKPPTRNVPVTKITRDELKTAWMALSETAYGSPRPNLNKPISEQKDGLYKGYYMDTVSKMKLLLFMRITTHESRGEPIKDVSVVYVRVSRGSPMRHRKDGPAKVTYMVPSNGSPFLFDAAWYVDGEKLGTVLGAPKGSMAITEPDGGELSLAKDSRGGLSYPQGVKK